MIDDDLTILVCLVTSKGRTKLAVTTFRADQEPVNEAHAMRELKHFRGVSEFVQTEIDSDLPGARMYLGEIERTDARLLLN